MLKIVVLISLFLSVILFAKDSQRIAEELNATMPEIPLKNALGAKEYDDAMNSGIYRYVGSSKCRLCHRKFFIGRKKDPHDSAMKSLVETGHENNSRCLTCHTTGHGTDTGFVNIASTPRLSNVQCEGCHGPGNIHIKLAKNAVRAKEKFHQGGFLAGQDNPQKLKKMCISCHTTRWNKSYHDIDKSYNSYKKATPKYN